MDRVSDPREEARQEKRDHLYPEETSAASGNETSLDNSGRIRVSFKAS